MPAISDTIRSKAVHVKLDKETHTNFRLKLVEHGVSMQEAFEEFARLIGTGNATANKIIERLINRQVKDELATVGLTPVAKRKPRRLSELSPDQVYDLINEEEAEEDDAEAAVER